jgi:VanZ family protein
MYRKLIFLSYILIVTALSLFPAGALPIPRLGLFIHADKVVHFTMYAGFTFLLFFAWPESFNGKIKQFIPLLYVFVWGSLMEVFQAWGGYGRSFSYLDITANTLGFLPGWLVWIRVSRKFPLAVPAED